MTILVVIGLILVACYIKDRAHRRVCSVECDAVVDKWEDLGNMMTGSRNRCSLVYSGNDIHGTVEIFERDGFTKEAYREGTALKIFVNPDNPNDFRLKSGKFKWVFLFLAYIFLVIYVCVGMWSSLF